MASISSGDGFLCAHERSEQFPRRGEILPVNPPQKIGAPGGKVSGFPAGLVDLALLGAVVALGAGAQVQLERQAVNLGLHDALKDFEQAG